MLHLFGRTAPQKEWWPGVNMAGAEWDNPRWPSPAGISYYASKGFRLIRIPFLWEWVQPEVNGALDATYLSGLKGACAAVTAAGMIPLIDCHNFWQRDGSPLAQSQYVDLWRRLAWELDDNIMLGLMNEPQGVSAATVVTAHNAAVAEIRSVGFSGWIVVSGTDWDAANDWVASGNAAAFANLSLDPKLIVEVHQYLDDDGVGNSVCAVGSGTLNGDGVFRLQPFEDWARANGRTAILSESSWFPAHAICQEWAPKMLAHMKANRTVWRGYSYWAHYPEAWGPWDSNPQLLNPLTGGRDRPQIATMQENM